MAIQTALMRINATAPKATGHRPVPPLLAKWEALMGVKSSKVFVQRMKTKWGSCNPATGRVWFNLELAKKPVQCLEYIVVHELIHLLMRHHNEQFLGLLNFHLPRWKEHREILNSLPLAQESWL